VLSDLRRAAEESNAKEDFAFAGHKPLSQPGRLQEKKRGKGKNGKG
jgi:hypothetical protein